MANTLNKQITSGADDGHHSGLYYLSSGLYDVIGSIYGPFGSCFRFTNIAIPKGSTITSAYIKLYADDSWNTSNGDPIQTKITGQDVTNAPVWDNDNVPDEETKTTAAVDWDFTPSTTAGYEHTSPDIKTIIQEIIDRSDWFGVDGAMSGNAIRILIDDNGSDITNSGSFESYDDIPSLSAKLVINYTNVPVNDARSAKTYGKALGISSKNATICGKTDNNRDARIHGGAKEDDARDVIIRGGLVADPNERNAVITGSILSERGASITGTKDWYHPNWEYRKALTIDHTKVAADQTDFPILVKLTSDDQLRDFAQSDGDDILFTNYNGTVKYNHEIELFTSATGALVAWVNVDALDHDADTTIYMYYGNPTATSQQNKEGTWETNFKGVWHMTDVTTSAIDDSTANNNDGTKQSANNPIQIDGKIYKGQDFDGATNGDKIDFPTASTTLQPANLTFETWIYRDTDWSAIDKILFFAKTEDTWNTDGYYVYIKGAATAQGIGLIVSGGNGVYTTETNPNNLFPLNAWSHLVITWNSTTNTATCKINNVAKTMTTAINSPDVITGNTTSKKRIGPANAWTTSYMNMGLDEMRIHATDRDANWLTTNYNTQSSPSTFYALGSQEGRVSERNAKITGVAQGWDSVADWAYRKKITIQASKVDADLTGYPLLISLTTDSDLAAHAKTDGSDIIFVDANGTKLPREIEKYTTATGLLVAHVKVNVLNNTDVPIYMLFGNVNAAEVNSTDTWDSDFNAVWHMTDDPNTSTIQDSTANNLDGTKKGAAEPTEATGQIYKAQSADGSNDFISLGTSALLAPANLTGEFWITRDDDWNTSFNKTIFWAKTDGVWNSNGWYLVLDSATHTIFCSTDGGTWFSLAGSGYNLNALFPLHTPTKLTIGWNSTDDTAYIYVNDVSLTIGQKTGTSITDPGGTKELFRNGATYHAYLKTVLDETKISKVKRATGYVTTMYKNESDPSSFYTLGAIGNDYFSFRGARISGGVNSIRNATILGKDTSASEKNGKITGGIIEISEREVTIHGTADINSDKNAVIQGQSTDIDNKNRSARIIGKDTANDTREVTIIGQIITNSEKDSVITGQDTSNNERGAVIQGKVDTTSDRLVVITGKASDNSAREAVIQGQSTDYSAKDASIHGQDISNSSVEARITGDSFKSDRLSTIHGKSDSNDTIEARIIGKLDTLDTREAIITGKVDTDSIRGATIVGKQSDNSERSAVITGIAVSSDKDAVIAGQVNDLSERDASIQGKATTNSTRDTRITGEPFYSTREAKIIGKDSLISELDSKITGQDNILDTRNAVITGKTSGEYSERDVIITGQVITNSEKVAIIHGTSNENSERLTLITGKVDTSSERSASITGYAETDERDAVISGKLEATDVKEARIIGKATNNSERLSIIIGKQNFASSKNAVIEGKPSTNDRNAIIIGKEDTFDIRNASITGGLITNSERNASITGIGSHSERGATIKGAEYGSERNAVINGVTIASSEKTAVVNVEPLNSIRSAIITGAKCPWYEKDTPEWQNKAEVNWYTKVPKKIDRQARKLVCPN